MTPKDRAQPPVKCQICGRPLTLQQSKISEHGKHVHQACYFTSIKKKATPKTIKEK